MLKYNKIAIPLSNGTWTKTETSSGKVDYRFTSTDLEQVVRYSVKDTGLKAVSKNAAYQKTISNNPITEFVAISSKDRKLADEILQFMRNYGFLFRERAGMCFSADEFCYLSRRLRLLLDIIEGLRLLDFRKAHTLYTLLQSCVEIQSSCRTRFGYSWTAEDRFYDDYWGSDQEGPRPLQYYYSFSNLKLEVDNVNAHEKCAETKALFTRALESASAQNEDDQPSHDYFETRTLELLIKFSEMIPFYFSGTSLVIEDKRLLDQTSSNAKEFVDMLSSLAEMIIEKEINYVVSPISYVYSAKDLAATPESMNLFELMYFSLMVLDHDKYIYTDCANPRCKKKVLKSITGTNGAYCCYACRKRHNAAEIRATRAHQKGCAAT